MSLEQTFAFMVLAAVIEVVMLGALIGELVAQRRLTAKKEAEWVAERRDFLDRIQAPSFQDYTNKVIREKKAEQPPDEKEKPVEFIS